MVGFSSLTREGRCDFRHGSSYCWCVISVIEAEMRLTRLGRNWNFPKFALGEMFAITDYFYPDIDARLRPIVTFGGVKWGGQEQTNGPTVPSSIKVDEKATDVRSIQASLNSEVPDSAEILCSDKVRGANTHDFPTIRLWGSSQRRMSAGCSRNFFI